MGHARLGRRGGHVAVRHGLTLGLILKASPDHREGLWIPVEPRLSRRDRHLRVKDDPAKFVAVHGEGGVGIEPFERLAERHASARIGPDVAGDEFEKRPDQIIVNMFSGDDVRVGGVKHTVADLPVVLLQEKQQHLTHSVIVRGNKQMSYRDLSNLMGACARAGIDDVTFATLEAR